MNEAMITPPAPSDAATPGTDPWTVTPTIVGRCVTLRPLARDDAAALVAAAAHDRAWEMFFTTVPGPATVDAWIDRAFAEKSYARAMPFAAVAPDGQVIGSTRFLRMSPANRRVEIGSTFYAAPFRRSGVNTEAKLMLLTYAFETLGCQVVEIRTDWLNVASRAAIARLGAKQDGVLRNHVRAADGRRRDTVVFSIVDGEWDGIARNLRYQLESRRDDGGSPPPA